ncbi:NfeD family protein [Deinococcus cellulosilyticus]|uniref:Membrane protein n=1 Tax=Deinococcus cellulosilyticus (strain DSM 18568 / NBRC 106333 / KACC 11606 / 5516J-15) TaxID=1223518 RepID=A0A511NA82_DEIC1|nr:NfeD family protein [Deinococcus cellulosilyticus]GEM49739.1 membrane protein [Deinococcus cellulosilyticus NBRC 106333 = KACC 11606]
MDGLSPWMWWIAGAVLMVLEILLPGFFLLWLGLGAAGTGVLLWLVPALSVPLQLILFAVLSVVLVGVFRGVYLKQLNPPTTEHLNDRTEALIGRICTVTRAIQNGQGQVKVGDSVWRASGPDVQAGGTVRIVGAEGTTLKVVPVE